MAKHDDYPILAFNTPKEWRAWLRAHHKSVPGVWLKMARKSSGAESITYPQALDEALCYGWIDGQTRSLDENYWLQKYTPRGKRSIWSKVNREHVARLIASGAMRAPGLAAVEAAKADGRWERAYDSPGKATIPADLQEALDANPRAKAFFAKLTGQNRYSILHRVQTAVKPETRARRIAEFVAMLSRGETIYPNTAKKDAPKR